MPKSQILHALVTYDVSTETREGKRRLRKVAIACCAYGQRVQNSVFECRVTPAQLEALEARLLVLIDVTEDRLRLYTLPADYDRAVRIYGLQPEYDLKEPLIV